MPNPSFNSSQFKKDEATGKLSVRMRKMPPVSICIYMHVHTAIYISTNTHRILLYIIYEWSMGDFAMTLSRLSFPLSCTSFDGRLILCCIFVNLPFFSSLTVVQISLTQVNTWLAGEKGGRDETLIAIHFLYV